MAQQARFTDVVGWLEGERLGVILPETERPGARRFVDKLSPVLHERGVPAYARIYEYPEADATLDDEGQLAFESDLTATGTPNAFELGIHPGGPGRAMEDAEEDIEGLVAYKMPVWKRLFDICGALAGLTIASPALLGCAAVIKFCSPGPVFFKQDRVGYGGRLFKCWKLRTMHLNIDTTTHRDQMANYVKSDQPMTKLDTGRDKRLIPLGKLMRITALDELPQLINVLRGEMSLIGPRPCIPYEAETFETWQRQRFDTMPGMTGLWQVNGKNRTSFNQMVRYDITYSRGPRVLGDLWIVLKTVPAIFIQIMDTQKARRMRAWASRAARNPIQEGELSHG